MDTFGHYDRLGSLAQKQWFWIFSLIRRFGYSPSDAEDLTQGFLTSLWVHNSIEKTDLKGRSFHSFLITSLRYFLCDEHDRASAKKRGGGKKPVSLDADSPEAFYARQIPTTETPELSLEREWADSVLDLALERLRAECRVLGKESFLDDVGGFKSTERTLSYADIAARHGLTEGAARLDAFRLRQRYLQFLREAVRETAEPGEVEVELRHLLRILAN